MATLEVLWADLQEEVALALGWDRTPGRWSPNQDDDFQLIVNAGMRRFYSGEIPGENKTHNWSFLYPQGELTLTAAYSTGTVDIVGGDASQNGGIGEWPLWAALGAELWWGDERSIVTTRDSSVVIKIADTTSSATAATYTLRRLYYDLPTDFSGMYSDGFSFRRDEQWHLPDIKIVGESDIRRIDRENSGDIYPRYASLVPVSPNLWRVRFFPLAEEGYRLVYRYKVAPAKVTSSNTTPYGGAYYGEAIIAAVVDAAHKKVNGSDEHHQEFLSSMRQAVFHDRRNFSVHTAGMGVNSDRAGRSTLRGFRQSTSISNITTDFL